MVVPFLIGTLSVVFMFQANYLIFLFKQFSPSAIPWTATAQLVLYGTPSWMNYTLPVGTSLAASLAITRLARESELTAMRSAGTSILRVMMPVIIFGGLIAGLCYANAEYLMPLANKQQRNLYAQVAVAGAAPEFRSNVSLNLQGKVAIIGTVARGTNNTIQLTDVVLYEKPSSTATAMTFAESGKYQDGVWTFPKYKVWIFEGDTLLDVSSKTKPMVIKEPVTIETIFSTNQDDELPAEKLLAQIKRLKRQGFDTRSAEIQYHTRFSVPASCLIFALVAPIFAIVFARAGAFIGVLLSLVGVLLYYNGFVISTQILGATGTINPLLAAWLPNIIFFVIGLFALRRLE